MVVHSEPSQGVSGVPLPPFISQAARNLKSAFGTANVRIWRYVDSQRVLFGCPTCAPEECGEPPAFEEHVAFLREPGKLAAYVSPIVVPLSDVDVDGHPQHPLWHVPDYASLPKAVRQNYIESILVNDPRRKDQSIDELVGVVCIDAPYAIYRDEFPDTGPDYRNKAAIEEILTKLRDELRNYSNSLFRSGFDRAQSFLRGWPRTQEQEQSDSRSMRGALDSLLGALDSGSADVSLYLRAYNKGAEVPLGDGIGTYYEKLLLVETRLRAASLQFPESLFSAKAAAVLDTMREGAFA